MELAGLVKVGLWGGNAGSPWELGNSSVRLDKIIIYSSDVINSFSFHYQVDGKLHTAGPWGNASGTLHEITFREGEYLTAMSGTHGRYTSSIVDCIRSLKFETNLKKTLGPYGDQTQGTPFTIPVSSGRIVGFFGRSGDLLDAIGLYLRPN
ncbi:salt stress-induced protein-like isoform X1 [Typha latifolia]|uniref:salt stress-induced protein-like isoform X1 n=1 Tax=Typha latifolia TaxID=4733 RepID=UPI003C2F7F0F